MTNPGTETEASTSNERKYVEPVRSVKSVNDMALWEKSTAYYDIIGFINAISQSIQGKKLSMKLDPSPIADNFLRIFVELNKMVDEIPPLDQPQRFGNKAYHAWFEKMKSSSPELLKKALPAEFHPALIELSAYFVESFGNTTRIDYGTGHELAFIMFLCALYKIHALTASDNLHVGLKIFNAYLQFVRRLQLTYRMEPAGSHGVWSMDDYQFVPFIWGSAQLANNAPFEPHHFLESDVIDRYKHEFYFIGCIDYILQVKTGSFAEHSNQLCSIRNDSWVKINSGLVKKYQKELLAKFPVVQHVLFGSILEFKEISFNEELVILVKEMNSHHEQFFDRFDESQAKLANQLENHHTKQQHQLDDHHIKLRNQLDEQKHQLDDHHMELRNQLAIQHRELIDQLKKGPSFSDTFATQLIWFAGLVCSLFLTDHGLLVIWILWLAWLVRLILSIF